MVEAYNIPNIYNLLLEKSDPKVKLQHFSRLYLWLMQEKKY